MAKKNLQESQSKMKIWYDRKAKSRCFEPGDRVLVLFPVVGNPLQAKYSGPYVAGLRTTHLLYGSDLLVVT